MWLGANRAKLGLKEGTKAFWWKTYSPPVWLLNTPRDVLDTTDLMGMDAKEVEERLREALGSCTTFSGGTKSGSEHGETILVAPKARKEPGVWRGEVPDPTGQGSKGLKHIRDAQWTRVWSERRHVGLDDLDFVEDGVWGTVSKVVRERGLEVWKVRRECG